MALCVAELYADEVAKAIGIEPGRIMKITISFLPDEIITAHIVKAIDEDELGRVMDILKRAKWTDEPDADEKDIIAWANVEKEEMDQEE